MPEGSGSTARIRARLEIEPLDVLFFRDARPFDASSRAASGLPMPQTIAGAVRTLLADLHGVPIRSLGNLVRGGAGIAEALSSLGEMGAALACLRLQGPWFSLEGEPLAPMPANLRREKRGGGVVRLDPLREDLPGWRPPLEGMRPLWRRGRATVEGIEGYLSPSGLRRFLEGGVPETGEIVPARDVYDFEDRTGIGIDDGRGAADDGSIYAVRLLSLRPAARVIVECEGAESLLEPLLERPALMRLGGESRQARVLSRGTAPVWPRPERRDSAGKLLLLTTPAPFDRGWRPSGMQPLAAAVGSYQAVSGWDLATGGPKPNRFFVPAGSVYFLGREDSGSDDDLVEDADAALGWGSFLQGYWDHA